MKRVFAIICSALLVVGCTLEEKVISSSTPENYYKTVEQCKSGLNGCYPPLKSIYGNHAYFQATEVATDLMYLHRTERYDAMCNYTPSSPRFGATIWNQSYLGIMRCNAMYAAISRSPLHDLKTEEEREEARAALYAECVILRAFYYYILTNNFGDVPFYTEEVTDANNDQIARLGRESASKIRNTLIDELWYWLIDRKALPLIKTYDPDNDYRIAAAVGFMLGGKMCLWEQRWTDAIEMFGYIEDIYGNGRGVPSGCLSKYPLSDIPFSKKYTGESIFELPAYHEDYGLTITSTLATICTPMRKSSEAEGEELEGDPDHEVQNDIYGTVGIPELGTEARTVSPIYVNDRFWCELMPQNSTDRRRAQYDAEGNLIDDAGGYMAWGWSGWRAEDVRSKVERRYLLFDLPQKSDAMPGWSKKTNRPYLGNKFWCPNMVYNYDRNNFKIFRFAGALLGLAEAHCKMGEFQTACDYLNVIKNRAGINTVSAGEFADEPALMSEIQDECARELFGEFNRRHDLVRWGIWYDVMMKYGVSNTTSRIKDYPCRQYYPIPDQQVVLSGGALDNNEYAKYGL